MSGQRLHRLFRKQLASWLFTLFAAIAATAVVQADENSPIPVKIAIVNVSSLLESSPQSKAANDKLKADFVPREDALGAEQKAIRELEENLTARIDAGTLSDDDKLQQQRELRDRQRKYARAMEDFREEVRSARDIAIDTLQNQIVEAIGEVREKERIDVVLRESDYIVASDRIDITGKVMQHLEQKFQAEQATSGAKPQE
ncbi:MAG: OmpH family outer membrane protein [Gammaproteobacteria bacterium]|nr:OmpH family outer membrane protein [Gammaproteobacteria bacterium]MBU1723599.1 OmpH family outer membrane protein [Gammaproteobacteria bacterium]MBU2004254.1 OmpH family outer membrane protein [Gammaproteobacteria bacterium]